MAGPSPAPHGADSGRYTLAGDVHLLLVNPMGEVLFGKRQETGYEDGAWQLPSGHLEAGESVITALIREAREQTGVAIDEQDVEFAHVMHNSSGGGRMDFFFVVQKWAGEPEDRESGECRQLEWFSLSALPYDLIPCCRVALEWIAVGHYFSVYGW